MLEESCRHWRSCCSNGANGIALSICVSAASSCLPLLHCMRDAPPMAYAFLSILSHQTMSVRFSATGAQADAAIWEIPIRKGADARCRIKLPSTFPLAGMN